MDFDFTEFFKKYEALLEQAKTVFKHIEEKFPDCVKCKVGCSDCCNALFDLTLIEALYINHHFNRLFEGEAREKMLEKANQADRKIYKIKREAYNASKAGKDEVQIFENIAKERVRCPLLNDENKCDMYEHRPITCRFYGIPTSIAGRGHTCGLSGFEQGKSYPTVKLDKIHEALYQISAELVASLHSRHVKMADLLVPLSMALITIYNDEYLGIKTVGGGGCQS